MGNLLSCGNNNEDHAVLKKFKVYTVENVKPSPYPQLVSGRVAPATHNLSSPVRQNPCVFYFVSSEHGTPQDGRMVWKKVFDETQCVDFVLADPAHPESCVAVHGRGFKTTVKVDAVANGSYAMPGNRLDTLWSTGVPSDSPTIQQLAARNKTELHDSAPGLKGENRTVPKTMRFFEFSFDINEQILLLGIVTERVGPDGKKMKFIAACQDSTLDAQYFRQYGWSETAQQAWHDLFKNGPAILASDDSAHFQGVRIEAFDADTIPEVLSSP